MRRKQARNERLGILRTLRAACHKVRCDHCDREHVANWIDARIAGAMGWVAMSEVTCGCGGVLYTYVSEKGMPQEVRDAMQVAASVHGAGLEYGRFGEGGGAASANLFH